MQKTVYYGLLFSCFMLQSHMHSDEISQKSLSWYGVTDTKDLMVATTLSTAFCGASFLVKDKGTRTIIQAAALLIPLVRFLSTTGVVKKTLNSAPLIKEVVGCTAVGCEGICSECVMRYTIVDAGIGAALISLSTPLVQSLIKRAELKKEEKEKVEKEDVFELNKECPICFVDQPDNVDDYKLMPCCQNRNWICNGCINHLLEHSHKSTIVCPLCRKDVDPYNQTIEDFKIPTQDPIADDAKKYISSTNNLFSAAFNKTLLTAGAMISSCATIFSYADHRVAVKDGALAVACSGVLLTLAAKTKDPVKQKQLLAVGLIAPFIGLINKSETIRKIGNSVPFLNHLFGCDKDGCRTICAHCKLRNAQRGAAALIGLSLLSPTLFGRS